MGKEAEVIERILRGFTTSNKIWGSQKLGYDLGLDSLDITECVMELEQAFTVTIPDGEITEATRVCEIIMVIDRIKGVVDKPSAQADCAG